MLRLRQILIFLVGLSIPFNNVGVYFAGRSWSLGLISSALYFFSMLSEFGKFPSVFKYYGNYLLSIIGFALILTLFNIFNINHYGTPVIPTSIILCFFLLFILLLHEKLHTGVVRFSMYGLVAGCILMAFFFITGVGVEIGEGGRLMMFGENSNELGIYMAIASVIIITEWIVKDSLNLRLLRFVWLVPLIPMVILLLTTGSRVAFISFMLSIIIYVILFKNNNLLVRILVWVLGSFALFLIYQYLLNSNSIILDRLLTTIDDGNLSGRDDILESLWPYVLQNLFGGLGQTGYVDVAQEALGKVSVIGGVTYGFSPHNVIVEILLYTGLLGLVLWIVFWSNIIKSAVRSLKLKRNLLPLLFLIPLLGCILSAQLLTSKWAYLLYAYIITAGSVKGSIMRG